MFGSLAAIVISILITIKQIRFQIKEGVIMSKELKNKLILYAIITSISFSYLVLPESAGISVPIFVLIQFVCLWFTVPDRKKLVLFVPIFIMSLNCFISANNIWRLTNFLLSGILYSCMLVKFNFKNDSLEFITNVISGITSSFTHFPLPFKWILELNTEKAPVIKRIFAAFVIALPCTILLIAALANADMVFSIKTEDFMMNIFEFFNANVFFKILYGIIAGLFAFGILYNTIIDDIDEKTSSPRFKGDLIIINILLVSVLTVYTLFVIIQFKYLFAGTTLPEGLTYTEYARKGFFELLALTGVNIVAILIITRLIKSHNSKWLNFTKVLCHYLCAVTVILLISSFFRMLLYTNDDGLTRLRFFVMGFLVFEAIGLLITFIYIAKPKFNIVLVYFIIALSYYTVLNIVPADSIIAKNQIDKYLQGKREDVEYIYSLSTDAAPAMNYLTQNTDNEKDITDVKDFLTIETHSDIPERWQRFNISTQNAKKILKIID